MRELQKNLFFCFTDYVKAFDCVDHNKLWRILQEMGIPDHLTSLRRNLYADQEATVRTGHGKQTGFKSGKQYVNAIYYHPACLTSMQSTSCKMPGWMKHQLESRLLGKLSITSDMQMTLPADDTTLMAESKELKSLLMKVKKESEKVGLKTSEN